MRLSRSALRIGGGAYFDRQLIAPQIHKVARWRLGRMMTLSGATKLLMSLWVFTGHVRCAIGPSAFHILGCLPPPRGSSIDKRQWSRHHFQGLAFRGDTPAPCNSAGGDHQQCADEISAKYARARAGVDKHAE